LRGARLAQATKLAQLPAEERPQALQRVANHYSMLMDQRLRDRQKLSAASVMEQETTR
jgi:hypothetical protein